MSGFIVENIKDNTTYYNKTKDEEMILAVMEEGEIKTNSIPYFYYEKYFKEYFIDEKKCTFDDSRIKCTNKLDFIENTNISIILGDYQFILSPESAWDGDKLNFVFSKENITRLSSSFLGNYYRIYDINEEKIYFSEVDGNIVLFNPNVTLVWVIIVLIVFLVLVICIIISILLTRTKNDKSEDNVPTKKLIYIGTRVIGSDLKLIDDVTSIPESFDHLSYALREFFLNEEDFNIVKDYLNDEANYLDNFKDGGSGEIYRRK